MASLSETGMLSPLPRKLGLCVSPSSCSPSKDALDSLHVQRPFWYNTEEDEEATRDLQEVLSGQCEGKPWLKLPDRLPASLPRSLSKASTCAGASPAWDDQLSPLQCTSPVSVAATPQLKTAVRTQDDQLSPLQCTSPVCVPAAPQLKADVTTEDAQGPRRNPSWKQESKVFVGGVPQHMEQKEFYKIFSNLAKVKKAWLQMFHNEHHESRAPSGGRKHRGFGYVVFSEKLAVDEILGEASKRFLEFEDGLRLEVKRAVGKETPAATDTTRARGVASALQRASPSSTPQNANTCSPVSPTPGQLAAPASLPYVPPFPSSWVTFVPVFMAPCPPVAPQTPPQQHMAAPSLSLYNTLLDGFVGQKPSSPLELEHELLRAAAAAKQYSDAAGSAMYED